jgi:hypothetical protein
MIACIRYADSVVGYDLYNDDDEVISYSENEVHFSDESNVYRYWALVRVALNKIYNNTNKITACADYVI